MFWALRRVPKEVTPVTFRFKHFSRHSSRADPAFYSVVCIVLLTSPRNYERCPALLSESKSLISEFYTINLIAPFGDYYSEDSCTSQNVDHWNDLVSSLSFVVVACQFAFSARASRGLVRQRLWRDLRHCVMTWLIVDIGFHMLTWPETKYFG